MTKKKFVFISDFDGTLTNKDFYQMIIDDYLVEEEENIFTEWNQNEYVNKDFFDNIYNFINRSENEVLEDILRIEWDDWANEVIEKIQQAGGDFVILSVGTSYYIERILEEKKLSNIKVYSNPGVYRKKGFRLNIDEKNPYYSEFYGIDKEKVVRELKEKYSRVYYAGDSAPDIPPCRIADVCFAKGALQEMLKNEKVKFVPINDFRDVKKYLIDKGVME